MPPRHALAAAGATAVLALAAAAPARAAVVGDCTDYAMATHVMEPWEQHSRTFYGGRVRLAVVDTDGEPACCSSYLVVIFPDPDDELGGRTCRMVSQSAGLGFLGVDMRGVRSSYAAATGLKLLVPVRTLAEDGATARPAVVGLRLDLRTGRLSLEP